MKGSSFARRLARALRRYRQGDFGNMTEADIRLVLDFLMPPLALA